MSVIWHQQTHGVPIRKAKSERTIALLFLAFVVVITLLLAAYLALVADNVRLSREIWQIEQDLMAAERETQTVASECARLSSIPVLQERSTQLGYQPANQVEYLSLGAP
ncbi:MAG: hypothetical protein JW981_04405 [Anaerolineae bacterium]|nr:hypothetical protein [Anaerolineae bacterium]